MNTISPGEVDTTSLPSPCWPKRMAFFGYKEPLASRLYASLHRNQRLLENYRAELENLRLERKSAVEMNRTALDEVNDLYRDLNEKLAGIETESEEVMNAQNLLEANLDRWTYRFWSFLKYLFNKGQDITSQKETLLGLKKKAGLLSARVAEKRLEKMRLTRKRDQLTAPCESIDYALDHVSGKKEALTVNSQYNLDTLHNLLDEIVLTRPMVLQQKINRVEAFSGGGKVRDAILELRKKLQMAYLEQGPPEEHQESVVLGGSDHIKTVIEKGFSMDKVTGNGVLVVRGEGTKRVRKSRTIPSTDGTITSETYHKDYPVSLQGEMNTLLSFWVRVWSSTHLCKALAEETEAFLTWGRNRHALEVRTPQRKKDQACDVLRNQLMLFFET